MSEPSFKKILEAALSGLLLAPEVTLRHVEFESIGGTSGTPANLTLTTLNGYGGQALVSLDLTPHIGLQGLISLLQNLEKIFGSTKDYISTKLSTASQDQNPEASITSDSSFNAKARTDGLRKYKTSTEERTPGPPQESASTGPSTSPTSPQQLNPPFSGSSSDTKSSCCQQKTRKA